jgi:RHS repeat-associated protein
MFRESGKVSNSTASNGATASGGSTESSYAKPQAPAITLPKGGGAIRGMGEKFAANPVTGTGSMTVPVATSPGRSGFGPQLSISYDSGAGNGPFGFGWSLSLPAITRKTDKGLPRYFDAEESDVFILSGAEDLVPVLNPDGSRFEDTNTAPEYVIHRYRPRIEGLFARIERWTEQATDNVHWRSISKDNVLTLYGKDGNSRIAAPPDPDRPGDPTHIFSWLICETRDDKGNAVLYEYKAEDGAGLDLTRASEANRGESNDLRRRTNRYLKHIRYGNRVSLLDAAGKRPHFLTQAQIQGAQWMFETVLDYGEHDAEAPTPGDGGEWLPRNDPFSTYRAGFEVRTCRLCQRVLMFHHFPDESDVGADCLVRSTDFTYSYEEHPDDARNPIYSFLLSVTQSGYRRDGGTYLQRSLPPVEFEYSLPIVQDVVETVDAASLENLPAGLGGAYQWTDLHGEGIPGILTEQAGAWFYKRNISPINEQKGHGPDGPPDPAHVSRQTHVEAAFAPVELVAHQPILRLADGAQFMDLAGDGQPDLVALQGTSPGLYENDGDEGWQPFRPFMARLIRDTRDPNLRFVDLDGDGHADVLISEDDAFVWHPSLAEEGFGPAERVAQALDEEKGPRLVFADGEQSVYLADLSGDGLTDLVRIRNGEVCYWPNLGYGHFGAKVTMDDAPWFDNPDQFDQRRVRLADIDGSGTTDIIYLHRDGVRLYFNQSGNGWSAAQALRVFPQVDNLADVQTADLLGNGTACLVWSSPLPGDAGRQMRYVDLMGGQKPHLLVKTANNLGAETQVQYASSVKFYLLDKRAGKPWITKLPFPVHVVERVETHDHVSRNRFVTRYAYHHGYFDGEEREFRGFGMVEQRDTEEFAALTADGSLAASNQDAASHVPSVLTKTWFHTGIYLGGERVSNYFSGIGNDTGEYYREPDWLGNDDEAQKRILPDTILPDGLPVEEEREAARALKGSMLRQEVYALDGIGVREGYPNGHPYTVAEQNFTVSKLQPRGGNRHTVFFTHPREAITYHYERNPQDPRVQHALTLEVDAYGNVLKSLAVGYGRRASPLAEEWDRRRQLIALITYTENDVTHPIGEGDDPVPHPDDYRTPLAAEARTYEVTGFQPTADSGRFTFDEWARDDFELLRSLTEIPYEEDAKGEQRKRMIERVRTLYRKDDLSALLGAGVLEPRALPGESYKLAFTKGLLDATYTRRRADGTEEALLPNNPGPLLGGQADDRGGYVDLEGDGHWWIPSGRSFYHPEDVAAPLELHEAQAHFFLPRRYRDPFGHATVLDYDGPPPPAPPDPPRPRYDLLATRTQDALGNVARAANDYRVLQPRLVTDPNGNRTEAAFDALGLVAGTAVMGKVEGVGDTLTGPPPELVFQPDLTPAPQVRDFYNAPDPHDFAPGLLRGATTRIVYDLDRFRRTRRNNPDEPEKWLPACAATLARETHVSDLNGATTKIQVGFSYSDGFGREIQKKVQAEPGPLAEGGPAVNPRWVGSGWTVFNNKGKPVRQYEPFFSPTHDFEFGVEVGVSPVLFYDPLERVVATLHPNHTWEKVGFDPWQQTTYDVNDTVTLNPAADEDVRGFFVNPDGTARLATAAYLPTWHGLRTDPAHAAAFAQQHPTAAARTAEAAAAAKAAAHADTPTTAHFDALGRPFLTIARNRFERNGAEVEERYETRVELDIEGNQREVRDAVTRTRNAQGVEVEDPLGRVVMRYAYDMLGNRIHQASMEAGERWTLNDAMGKPIRAWDSRGFTRRMTYDELRRPLGLFVTENGAERLAERTVYGEGQGDALNHNTRVFQVMDGAGIVTSEEYDFKGNLLRGRRELLPDYKAAVDWNQNPVPNEAFPTSTTYDALNRPLTVTTPDDSVYRPSFNEANLLDKVDVQLQGAAAATPFVTNINYDARGQRELIAYANGAATTYDYDPLTFRLTNLKTTRPAALDATASSLFKDATLVQDLRYTYDPAGNITRIEDAALKTANHDNQAVEPVCAYAYDAVYRLIEATGREHIGQTACDFNPPDGNRRDFPFVGSRAQPNDPEALRTYTERYEYDEVGNFKVMRHAAAGGGWTRTYTYEEATLIREDAGKTSNRLTRTAVGDGCDHLERYTYKDAQDRDVHGCMTAINDMAMAWDFEDQLQRVDLGGGGTAYYVYDAAGQRVRKVIENQDGTRREERIYLGGYEVYRRHSGADAGLVRATLHVMDDKQRIALVETRNDVNDGTPKQVIRYQLANHLGSASLELADDAALVSYEEYHPYGTTAFQAVRSQVETPRRYRYTGKERDEETGFSYHGARYYIPWFGRWTSIDPLILRLFEPREQTNKKTKSSLNPYEGMANNPLTFIDPDGKQETGYERYLERQLSTPEGASRLTGIPYTPPPPLTAREQEAVDAGARLGRAYGQFEADLEEFNNTLTRRWSGVSLWDRLPQAERDRLTQNVIDAYNRLPQLTEHFNDPAVSGRAQEAFNRTRQETYSASSWGNRIRGFFLELAPFLAAGVISSLISTLRRAGANIVIDLFGGARSQIPGAVNVDIAATSGIRADVTRGLPLASGVADEVIVTNPYLRGVASGSNAANTWLPEAARILRPGGRITVTGAL